jgi:hypothetical protein
MVALAVWGWNASFFRAHKKKTPPTKEAKGALFLKMIGYTEGLTENEG